MRLVMPAVLALTLFGCASSVDAPSEAPAVLQSEAEHILLHAKEAPEGDYLLVVDKSIQLSLDQNERSSAEQIGIPRELLRKLTSDREHRLPWSGDGRAFRPVSRREIDSIFRRDPDWPHFYALYPRSRGFVMFAGPVFNNAATDALLYVSYNCYGDCGWGSLVHYKRTGDRWTKANEWLHWFS